jgi:HAAS
MPTAVSRLVEEYLARLARAAADLPAAARHDLTEDVRQHVGESGAQTEAEIRTVLDGLGSPEEITAEARRRLGLTLRPAPKARDWAVIPLLLIGGIVVPVVGWFVGVFLLWTSQVWSLRDKWLATLLPPGGLAGAMVLALFPVHTEGVTCPPTPAMPSASAGEPPGVVEPATSTGPCITTTSGLPTWVGMALAALAIMLPLLTAWHLARAAQRAARSSAAATS